MNDENTNPNIAPLTSYTVKTRGAERGGTVKAKAQYDVSCASKVFGMAFNPDADSLLNSSLTYSPSPTADRQTLGRNAIKYFTAMPSLTFNFESTDDPDPLLLTERFSAIGDQPKSAHALESTVPINCQQLVSNPNERKKTKVTTAINVAATVKPNSFCKDELMRRMQQAVSSASRSVNDSLNAVRQAKKESEQEKIMQTQKFREAHRSETEEAAAFQAEAERQRRELLALKHQEMHNFQKAKVEREQAAQQERMHATMKESLFKSEVFRAHKKDLREAEERRKRMSVDVRTKIRAENRLGVAKIETVKLEEDQAIIDERYERSKAIQQARSLAAAARRKSLIFRNGDAGRIRTLHANIQHTQQLMQHQSYELKWTAEKDAEEYKRQCDQERRNSFAFRNQEGRKIREIEERMLSDQLSADHASFEVKWAAEKDAEVYKRQCEQERRDSFSFRNHEGRKIREAEERTRSEQLSTDHENYELKWASDKDAEKYKMEREQERRDSFALRNQEGRKIREVEQRKRAEQVSTDHESYELKWASEKDAKEYQRQCEQQKRDSFAFRNQEGGKIRQVEERMKSEQLSADHESYELKWAGEKDAEEYKRQCEQERRESFAFRNQEGRKIREVEERMRSEQLSVEHESYELKWAAENDAEQYMKTCEDERRLSLQWRGQEAARHRAVMDELSNIMKQKEHESMVLKWAGEEDVKEYLDQCAANERASLVFKGKEARLIRLKGEDCKTQELEKMKENFKLEAAAGRDVQGYVEKCKKRNRLSLAFRAKEKRRHADWEKETHDLKIEDRSREIKVRALDARYVKLAQDRERAMKAIEAIRHAGRNFSSNPFASVLD